MIYITNWLNNHVFDVKHKKDIKGKNPIENPYVFAKLFRGNPYIKEVTLHKETIYIEDKAFKDCKSLERINIPPKVEYLTSQSPIPPKYYPDRFCCLPDAEDYDDDKLLYFCVRIRKLFTEKSNCFEGVDRKRCIIKVPKGSIELYKKALEWKDFENIVEIW